MKHELFLEGLIPTPIPSYVSLILILLETSRQGHSFGTQACSARRDEEEGHHPRSSRKQQPPSLCSTTGKPSSCGWWAAVIPTPCSTKHRKPHPRHHKISKLEPNLKQPPLLHQQLGHASNVVKHVTMPTLVEKGCIHHSSLW
jgi:hypothetical protein